MKMSHHSSIVSIEKFKQHMKSLRRSYTKAVDWRNKTGQGILISDENSGDLLRSELLKMCRYFDEFDEIIGTKPQYTPPFVHHSGNIAIREGEANLNNSCHEASEKQIIDDAFNEENYENIEIFATSFTETPEINSLAASGIYAEAATKNCKLFQEEKLLGKRRAKSPIKSAASSLEAAIKCRTVADQERLSWEKQVKQDELHQTKLQLEMEFSFKEKNLAFEKEKWEEERNEKRLSLEREHQLKTLQIEKEAEFQRIKLEKEYELKILKLRMNNQDKVDT